MYPGDVFCSLKFRIICILVNSDFRLKNFIIKDFECKVLSRELVVKRDISLYIVIFVFLGLYSTIKGSRNSFTFVMNFSVPNAALIPVYIVHPLFLISFDLDLLLFFYCFIFVL